MVEQKPEATSLRYIIVDLEATCWENTRDRDRMEILEIGAVEMPSAGNPSTREFCSFVRPIAEPILSDFCRELTTIRQRDVDQASDFSLVFPEFVRWIGDDPFILGSWGQYDLNQLRTDCARHHLPLPATFERHINIKKQFASSLGVKEMGMAGALKKAGLPLAGTHHRGIDDARNIARLAAIVLPALEASGALNLL